jgi:hypothetical protein
MLFASKPFFLRSGDQLPIDNQSGSRIMVKRRNPKNCGQGSRRDGQDLGAVTSLSRKRSDRAFVGAVVGKHMRSTNWTTASPHASQKLRELVQE